MPLATLDGPLAIGELFLGKYEILELIGRGGHACVYHALNSFMGRHVAIKVLHRPGGIDREALRRGQAEAQILSRLRDPNIVEVIDAGMTDQGLLYIVMELLTGCSLRQLLHDRGALPVDEVLALAAEIADGLQAAHETGAIHRDLKPENVFVTDTSTVKILDFGIAKLADAAALTTDRDTAHGTALYMSPEQLQLAKLTPRSDVYALGVVMYEALAGRHPVPLLIDSPAPSVWEISRAVLTREPPMLDELDARIPRSVAVLVNRAMAKLPEQRFATMAEFATAMRECRDAWIAYAKVHGLPVSERRSTAPQRTPSGHPRPSDPAGPLVRPSARPLPTPGTAAPVTTRTTSDDLGLARPMGARQVLMLGLVVGAALGGVIGFLRFGRGPEATNAASSALAPLEVSPPSAAPAGSPASPSAPEPVASEAPTAAPVASSATPPATTKAPSARPPQAPVRDARAPRKAAAEPATESAPAKRTIPEASSPPPKEKVDARLQRLERSLEK